jgi:hypothetical protein
MFAASLHPPALPGAVDEIYDGILDAAGRSLLA